MAPLGYLSSAVFGIDRLDYWTRCLDEAAGPERPPQPPNESPHSAPNSPTSNGAWIGN